MSLVFYKQLPHTLVHSCIMYTYIHTLHIFVVDGTIRSKCDMKGKHSLTKLDNFEHKYIIMLVIHVVMNNQHNDVLI